MNLILISQYIQYIIFIRLLILLIASTVPSVGGQSLWMFKGIRINTYDRNRLFCRVKSWSIFFNLFLPSVDVWRQERQSDHILQIFSRTSIDSSFIAVSVSSSTVMSQLIEAVLKKQMTRPQYLPHLSGTGRDSRVLVRGRPGSGTSTLLTNFYFVLLMWSNLIPSPL